MFYTIKYFYVYFKRTKQIFFKNFTLFKYNIFDLKIKKRESVDTLTFSRFLLEATPGFEPGIRVLQTRALPLGYVAIFGAGNGNRTRNLTLARLRFTTKLYLHVLYLIVLPSI